MKFNLSDYPNRKVVMHTETEEQSLIFRTFLDAQGKNWCGGESYLEESNFDIYASNTCYAFNKGEYCDYKYYKTHGYTILNFSDFEWDNYTPPEKEKPVELRLNWQREVKANEV